MCGRARCTLAPDAVGAACGFGDCQLRLIDHDRYRPSYNVSPGAYLPVVHYEAKDDGEALPVVQAMKWGLVPSFTKKNEKPDHYRMFNARSETVREKTSFSRLLPAKRCLVSVEGFYEWKKDGSKKQPYYIHFQDERPLVFACLYDSWQDAEGDTLFTFTILTTRVSKRLEWLHDRMPVILASDDATKAWLELGCSLDDVFRKFVQPYERPNLVWYPVTSAMGKPSFNGPDCIKEIKQQKVNDISRFFKRKPQESNPNAATGQDPEREVCDRPRDVKKTKATA
ncbi:embryonic stem cell-specific 5-hydroxymethylcytosine-binding protein-like isoform X1 [Selaginella moellendorffii]|uniref:embryonic stem cell-specific 5-hydroxymethylcytosine-binding protein-like isoform X1 n=1 Tax=Selaginella moellendorffii TaxID=88036 RepID=UPI000D1CF868|nr:embryonic stem cell-specific 5-hydroxymethylcytosine-binding protein-like isoform X1 [Selaginella moellendorffii]|eukprot:XP_024543738.1 embryonic stem cell-specific 5-hydroxymethylcytosine-binding protein-like isoform X1 [Selaginella moellendorffii]